MQPVRCLMHPRLVRSCAGTSRPYYTEVGTSSAAVLAALDQVQSPKITHLGDAPGSRCLLAWWRYVTRRGSSAPPLGEELAL
jgi:hypothetical protein